MTINDLEKYRILKIEIKELQEELQEILNCTIGSPALSGMPISKGSTTSTVEKTAQKRLKLQTILSEKLDKRLEKQIEIEDFRNLDFAFIRHIAPLYKKKNLKLLQLLEI